MSAKSFIAFVLVCLDFCSLWQCSLSHSHLHSLRFVGAAAAERLGAGVAANDINFINRKSVLIFIVIE